MRLSLIHIYNESLSLSILRLIGEEALKENTQEVHAIVPVPIASYLLIDGQWRDHDAMNMLRTLHIANRRRQRFKHQMCIRDRAWPALTLLQRAKEYLLWRRRGQTG